jgi:carboxyl-terminal processing protease
MWNLGRAKPAGTWSESREPAGWRHGGERRPCHGIWNRPRLARPGRRSSLTLLLIVLGVAGCATLPPVKVAVEQFPAEQQARAKENLRVFSAVWDLVNRRHYDPETRGERWDAAAVAFAPKAAAAKDDAELYRVINDMLRPLEDSHTFALTPVQALERKTRIRARTGFNMERLGGRWVVSEVLPTSPAEEAGVKVGWIVVARNGQPLGERIDFRAKQGETATWDFLDEKDQKVRLAPAARELSVGSRQLVHTLAGGFVYLRFDEFAAKDRRWLSEQLKAHRAAPGVVIDLRRNPGGETFSLGISIGEFFEHAVDCGTFITRSGSRSAKNSWQIGSARYRGAVAVLVDGASGSAAEIFAAVLQDHGRAKIIGRRTAGAVLASWFYGLPGGGELQLSREDYIAPKGRRIEGAGVEPDIVVPRTLEDFRSGRDRDLEEALRVLREQ